MAEGDLQEQYTRLKRSALELELEEIKAVKEAEQVALRGGSDAPTREGRGSVVLRSEDLYDEYNEISALGDEIQAKQRAEYLEMRMLLLLSNGRIAQLLGAVAVVVVAVVVVAVAVVVVAVTLAPALAVVVMPY